jgi:hypothetical protein
LSIAQNIPKEHLDCALYFRSNTFATQTYQNSGDLRGRFGECYKEVAIDNDDSLTNTDKMLAAILELADENDQTNLLVDITTFTRECLMIFTNILFQNRSRFNAIDFLYTPAEKMSRDWLTKAFENTRAVVSYSGVFSSSLPLHLILIAGFETERARHIINDYEPDYITIAFGNKFESTNNDYFDRNKKLALDLQSSLGYRVEQLLEIPLLSPSSIADKLGTHISKNKQSNTVIAPLNNKISTVGSALTAIRNPAIQLCYSRALVYNTDHYSEPSTVCYYMGNIFSPEAMLD